MQIEADVSFLDAAALALGPGLDEEVNGIDAVTVGHKRIDEAATVEPRLGRRGQVDKEVLVADVVLAQQRHQRIIVAAAHVEMHRGQHGE